MRFTAVLIVLFLMLAVFPLQARAQMCVSCAFTCVSSEYTTTKMIVGMQNKQTRRSITQMFQNYQKWIVNDFFEEQLLPSMMKMADQLSAVGMQQAMIYGTFLDASHQLAVQRTFQSLDAQAHKDYQPATGLCAVGTATKGMAASMRNGEGNMIAMAQASTDRQLGNAYGAAAQGRPEERKTRVRQFKKVFCDPHDNNDGFSFCEGGGAKDRINRDVDFGRTLDKARTLNLDFSDETLTGDEEDLLALARNLFGHDIFERPGERVLDSEGNQLQYLRARAVIAKRSVAENSFYAIAGLKAQAPGSNPYAAVFLEQMGVPTDEARRIVGNNPSYYGLLELLGQRLYQNPGFYTDLYDKPANIARKDVAMQAVGLMMDRDSYKSELRYEALLAQLLELETEKYQRPIQDRFAGMNAGGRPFK